MNKLKMIQSELNIVSTSLNDWLIAKLEIQNQTRNLWSRQWNVLNGNYNKISNKVDIILNK